MENKASMTAQMAAYARAYHLQHSKNPVFADPIAQQLLGDENMAQMAEALTAGIDFFAPGRRSDFADAAAMLDWVVNTQLAPTPLGRAAYCEAALETAIRTGTRQYVILGAGLDSFAWRRLDCMEKLTVFAVDHPATQRDTLARIHRAGLEIPENLHFVPLIFGKEDLYAALDAAGFDRDQKTFFSWLGVSFYLSENEIADLLSALSDIAADGSTLLFDCGDGALFSASEQSVQNMIAMAAAGGEAMQFCADERKLTSLLAQYHFLIYEYLSAAEIQQQFFDGRTDGLSAFPHVSYVLAVWKGTVQRRTKERILKTALQLFGENGYEAVSVKDIADRLSMTKGALYRHYESKRDIFCSIVRRMEQRDRLRANEYAVPTEIGTAAGITDEAGATEKIATDAADTTCDAAVEETMFTREREQAMRSTSEKLSQMVIYARAQFRYWTEDPFAAPFRRMLTLEQYRDAEMAALYQQYLSTGPSAYMTAFFKDTFFMNGKAAENAALAFYGVMFYLYSAYDAADDKDAVYRLLNAYLSSYSTAFQRNLTPERQAKTDTV